MAISIPCRDRASYQGYLVSAAFVASTFGPAACDLLSAAFGWQAIFLINLALGFAAIAIALSIRSQSILPKRSGTRFDWIGFPLFALTVTALLLALRTAYPFEITALPPLATLPVLCTASFGC